MVPIGPEQWPVAMPGDNSGKRGNLDDENGAVPFYIQNVEKQPHYPGLFIGEEQASGNHGLLQMYTGRLF